MGAQLRTLAHSAWCGTVMASFRNNNDRYQGKVLTEENRKYYFPIFGNSVIETGRRSVVGLMRRIHGVDGWV